MSRHSFMTSFLLRCWILYLRTTFNITAGKFSISYVKYIILNSFTFIFLNQMKHQMKQKTMKASFTDFCGHSSLDKKGENSFFLLHCCNTAGRPLKRVGHITKYVRLFFYFFNFRCYITCTNFTCNS